MCMEAEKKVGFGHSCLDEWFRGKMSMLDDRSPVYLFVIPKVSGTIGSPIVPISLICRVGGIRGHHTLSAGHIRKLHADWPLFVCRRL
jgi:hypothetical protein